MKAVTLAAIGLAVSTTYSRSAQGQAAKELERSLRMFHVLSTPMPDFHRAAFDEVFPDLRGTLIIDSGRQMVEESVRAVGDGLARRVAAVDLTPCWRPGPRTQAPDVAAGQRFGAASRRVSERSCYDYPLLTWKLDWERRIHA